ncbi:MAG: sn-glycerol-3-phosphate ABC transporter ATP-binding protein UgpC [Anaerolineae bacterium]
MAEIDLRGVTKIYSRGLAAAVDNLSLHIPDGQFAVLLGPSGCGKSTTLRMVAGLEEPDSGEIKIGGQIVNGVPPQRRDTAFVFQNYALYPHMTVAQNIGFPLKMRGMPAQEMRRRAEETARILGLEPFLDRFPGQLSGGERQRVAVGRAIVRNPAVFLFDEPLSNLDAQLRVEMRVELVQLQRRLGATFVFVTHDQVEAMTLADVIAVMRQGVLQQTGAPVAIYRQPANLFVAGFIGSPRMNFIEGRLNSEHGHLTLKTDLFTLPLPERFPGVPTGMADGKVILGIRPEHTQVCASDDEYSIVEIGVEVVEMLGSQQFIYGAVEGHPQKLTIGVDPRFKLTIGDRVKLSFPLEEIHFFNPKTGNRM